MSILEYVALGVSLVLLLVLVVAIIAAVVDVGGKIIHEGAKQNPRL